MTTKCYIPKNFSGSSMAIIEKTNKIIVEYAAQRLTLTLRQLYYQLVARGHIENTVQSYKRIGSIVSDARNAGLISWSAIEDRARDAYLPAAWASPAEIVEVAARQFRVDRWEGQENYVEVMVEKDALSGILQPLCSQYHVRFSANKGYSSNTMMHEAGERIRGILMDGGSSVQEVHILYAGDHDPSGIDMTRDVEERIKLYADLPSGYNDGETIQVHRLALNMPQVRTWNPPPNPAKETDSRFEKYMDEYGDESWELDAVEPATLRQLFEDQLLGFIDEDQWNKIAERETSMKAELLEFSKNYGKKKTTRKSK